MSPFPCPALYRGTAPCLLQRGRTRKRHGLYAHGAQVMSYLCVLYSYFAQGKSRRCLCPSCDRTSLFRKYYLYYTDTWHVCQYRKRCRYLSYRAKRKKVGGRCASAPSEEKKRNPFGGDPIHRRERAETAETAGVSHSQERGQQPHKAASRRTPHRPQPRGRPPPAAVRALRAGVAAGDAYRLVHQLAGADAAAVRGEDKDRLFKYPRVG